MAAALAWGRTLLGYRLRCKSTDVKGTLYSANYDYITSDFDSGEGENFWFTRTLNPGTYYLAVDGDSPAVQAGDYTLHVEGPGAGTVSDDHGYSPWSASIIRVGSATNGLLSDWQDQDFFKFTVDKQGTYSFFSCKSTDVKGTLYSANYDYITSDFDSGEGENFWFTHTLNPGTYYLAVDGDNSAVQAGDYTLHVEGPGAGTASDDHGHSPWSASIIRVGSATNGLLSDWQDQDFFKFTVDKQGTYSFFSRDSTDVKGTLYSANYDYITSDFDNGEGENFWFTHTLNPGTYYLAVEGDNSGVQAGDYTVCVETGSVTTSTATPTPSERSTTTRFDALPTVSLRGSLSQELAYFASTAYSDTAYTGGALFKKDGTALAEPFSQWAPVRDMRVASGSFEDGVYESAVFSAVAHVYVGSVNGEGTLVLAFRGTDDGWDVGSWPAPSSHYQQLLPLVDAVHDYLNRYDNIHSVLVTGHSLGGSMVQYFMSEAQDRDSQTFLGATFGSPGANLLIRQDSRLVHYEHHDDPVPNIGWTVFNGLSGHSFDIDRIDNRDTLLAEHDMSLYVSTLEAISAAGFDLTPAPDRPVLKVPQLGLYEGTTSRDNVELEYKPLLSASRFLIVGNDGDDCLRGTPVADVFDGGPGNDTIEGQGGIDTARYSQNSSRYDVRPVSEELHISGPDGTDTLRGVERLVFLDRAIALDYSGAAGTVVRALGAVFGRSSANNPDYIGIGLSITDQGTNNLSLMQIALDARLGPNASPQTVVDLLYSNLFGHAPTVAERATYTSLITSGAYSPASLAWAAAQTEVNAVNIDLVGVATTGIEFIPFSG